MKFEIRNIDGIRNLNYSKGNNEIYFLKTQPDGKKEKFKIADAVLEDNKLIYRFIENNKTSLYLNNLKQKLKKENSDKMFVNNFEWSKGFKFKNLTFLENGIWFDKRFMDGGEETVKYLKTLKPSEVTFAEVIGSELVLS